MILRILGMEGMEGKKEKRLNQLQVLTELFSWETLEFLSLYIFRKLLSPATPAIP